MKKILLSALAGLTVLFGVAGNAGAAADARIAFVNTARVLEQAPQAQSARDKLQREFSPRDAELVATQRTLKGMEERLGRDGAVMSDVERRKLERDIVSQQRELKRSQGEFSEDLNLRRNEEFAKLQRQAAEAIISIAKEKKFDLVLESGVVYASDKVDMTEEVISRLRKQFASKSEQKK